MSVVSVSVISGVVGIHFVKGKLITKAFPHPHMIEVEAIISIDISPNIIVHVSHIITIR